MPKHRRPADSHLQGNTPPADEQPDLFSYAASTATRAAAFQAARAHLSERSERILSYVSAQPAGVLRHDVARSLGMPLQSVCGPVLKLLREGYLREAGGTRLTEHGRQAAVLVAADDHRDAGSGNAAANKEVA